MHTCVRHNYYLCFIADDDVIIHRHWDLVDDKLQRRPLKDPHEARACPRDRSSWHDLSHHHLGVLYIIIIINIIIIIITGCVHKRCPSDLLFVSFLDQNNPN